MNANQCASDMLLVKRPNGEVVYEGQLAELILAYDAVIPLIVIESQQLKLGQNPRQNYIVACGNPGTTGTSSVSFKLLFTIPEAFQTFISTYEGIRLALETFVARGARSMEHIHTLLDDMARYN